MNCSFKDGCFLGLAALYLHIKMMIAKYMIHYYCA